MAWLNHDDRRFLQAVSKLTYCNPFLPERIEHEHAALGAEFREGEPVWSAEVAEPGRPYVNLIAITRRIETLIETLRERATAARPRDSDLELYANGVLLLLYQRYEQLLKAAMSQEESERGGSRGRCNFYADFARDWDRYSQVERWPLPALRPEHVFAVYFQLRRAFHMIFHFVIGRSMPAARLRAAVWESIFTHDLRRYLETLYTRMSDLNTLITGPSGTGKELVARAIGHSGYIPFDARKREFIGEFSRAFHAVNLSALPQTLVESELFGHRRGAFTGALEDRRSWLETCEPWGAVLLDEVGDLDVAVQVKLLRLLETRSFHALGDTKERQFRGRILAATNRDLGAALAEGRMRADFYYRLCPDVIATASLREKIDETPAELQELILYIARELAGDAAPSLAAEVDDWIARNLAPDYPWPGNIRELEQCVRSILIRKDYRPLRRPPAGTDDLVSALRARSLTAEELLRMHCTVAYAQAGSCAAAAAQLGLDRRTVKARIDNRLLDRIRRGYSYQ